MKVTNNVDVDVNVDVTAIAIIIIMIIIYQYRFAIVLVTVTAFVFRRLRFEPNYSRRFQFQPFYLHCCFCDTRSYRFDCVDCLKDILLSTKVRTKILLFQLKDF